MADLLQFPASAFVSAPDDDPVTGDVSAGTSVFAGRLFLRYDNVEEMVAFTPVVKMPAAYTGSGLTAKVRVSPDGTSSSNFRIEVGVEAVTIGDTADRTGASSWDTTNAASLALTGEGDGDPLEDSITLTNADSVAASDSVRFYVRRDTDHADDAAAIDMLLALLVIEDDG